VELLIIFLIFMLLSSLMKHLKGAAREGAPFPPPRKPPSPFDTSTALEEDLYEMEEEEQEAWSEYAGVERRRPSRKRAPGKRAPLTALAAAVERRRPAPSMQEAFPPQRAGAAAGEREELAQGQLGNELAELLKGEKLPLGIFAAEVLSAPRSRRPFQPRRLNALLKSGKGIFPLD